MRAATSSVAAPRAGPTSRRAGRRARSRAERGRAVPGSSLREAGRLLRAAPSRRGAEGEGGEAGPRLHGAARSSAPVQPGPSRRRRLPSPVPFASSPPPHPPAPSAPGPRGEQGGARRAPPLTWQRCHMHHAEHRRPQAPEEPRPPHARRGGDGARGGAGGAGHGGARPPLTSR